MLGFIILLILVGIEIGLFVFKLKTKSNQTIWKAKIDLGIFTIMLILVLLNIIHLSFRWYLLFIFLLFQAISAAVYLIKKTKNRKIKPERPYKIASVIYTCMRRIALFGFLLLLAIVFPQYKNLPVSGEYDVATASYTLEDTNRLEYYSAKSEKRKIVMEFWYPITKDNNINYPLVIFSHGSFGFRGSNYSTFMELASNGYVVCSIDHAYYSFFTKLTDGKVIIADQQFINDAIAIENNDYPKDITYELTHKWLDTRLADMNLVINNILHNVNSDQQDQVFQLIDTQNIGVFGHSIGGAASAQLGRERNDIDAVIVIDGTILGEEIDFVEGKEVLNDTSYPVPILDIFNEEHYQYALENKSTYVNMVMAENAIDARQSVFKRSGHLNFTDLPVFSPFLANMLGTGTIDREYCIETMNQVILSYFNHYLKNAKNLNILSEY